MEEQGRQSKTEQEIQDWQDEIVDYRLERDAEIKHILLRFAIPIIYLVAACIFFVSGTLEWNANYVFPAVLLLIFLVIPVVRYLVRYVSIVRRIQELESRGSRRNCADRCIQQPGEKL